MSYVLFKNIEVYQEGYVEIPDDVEESEDWFYYNQSGMVQPRMFTHHDGIGIKQIGATFEQEQEISEFLQEVQYDYVDWYYWTGNGYQSRPFYHHNKEEITGLTDIQNNEIDTFRVDYSNDALWIDTCILQSEEDENRTFVRENCTIIINGDD